MSSDSSAASSPSSSGETSRRRVLAFLGLGSLGALATLFGRGEAKAAHDGTNVLHLGENNSTPEGKKTEISAHIDHFMLDLANFQSGGQAGGMNSLVRGGLAAVQGTAVNPGRTGVFGVCVPEDGPFGTGAGVGVLGMSGNVGVEGISDSSIGVQGTSDTGVGGAFSSNSGKGLQVDGRATIFASGEFDTLIVDNQSTGEFTGAISGTSRGGKAVEGVGLGSETTGVVGASGEGPEYGMGPGTGVRGLSGTGTAVHGFSGGTGTGVDGESESGIGVRGISNTGIGVQALNASFEGFALVVGGKSRFETAGSAVIPAGENSAFVPNPAVTGESHVSVTLVGNPGPRQVAWVERSPGSGFTVHLTPAPLRRRPETPFTYLAVEPG